MNIRRFIAVCMTLAVAAALAVSVISVLTIACGDNPSGPSGEPDSNGDGGGLGADWVPVYTCAAGANDANVIPDINADDFGLANAIVVTLDGSDAVAVVAPAIDDDAIITVTTDGGHVELIIRNYTVIGYNVIVRGETNNGSLRINRRAGATVNVFLDGVNITNPEGPALNIQGVDATTFIHLVAPTNCGDDQKRNILADGPNYATPPGEEQAKGTLFSERSVVITGGGSLEIWSRFRHALVVDRELSIESGNIIIHESASDGIHTNRNINISGGKLQIKSQGDAMQAERGDRDINITGGQISILTTGIKSHGLASDSGDVNIGGNANIMMTLLGDGSKGIRSRRDVSIDGGTLDIRAHGNIDVTPPALRDPDDPDSTSRAGGIRAVGDVSISAGSVNIISSGNSARGINSDGDVTVSGGTTSIVSNGDGVKVGDDGYFRMSGGTLRVRVSSGQDIDCGGRASVTGGTLDAVIDGRSR